MELDSKIYRHFTSTLAETAESPREGSGAKPAATVYDLFKWKTVDVKLRNYATGEVITDMSGLEFPENYSQTACDIIAGKYFRKRGVPEASGGEFSMKQLTHRMVRFWADALCDEGVISPEQWQIVYDELAYMTLAQMWAPNSPQWFNTGLKYYGLRGAPQGHYYYDTASRTVVESKDAYTRTQGSACFILSVADSLLGDKSLTDLLTTETLLFKYGSGVGANWSAIRAKNETLSGGGKSSGLLSFLKVSDRNAGAIKSGGTTRRAAKMNILNLDHPEIMEYIMWKAHEEEKVEALGKMGYSTSIDGEAYETVSGQNVNNSIRVTDAFMEALDIPGATVVTSQRVTGEPDKEIPVSDIMESAAYAAWRCGDPGIQFDGRVNAWHTCPCGEDGEYNAGHNRINASNPCSEYMFLDDTACNLASINLLKFCDGAADTGFDIEGYKHCVKMVQLVMEATIHWGQFPTRDIARKSHLFRTTGMGYTNLGTLLMTMGLPYDSDDARALAAALCAVLTGYSYYISALIAEKVGAFQCYELNKDHMKRVLQNHARAARCDEAGTQFESLSYEPQVLDTSRLARIGLTNVSDCARQVWRDALAAGGRYGYRNAQVSVLAPTGTIAFAMDCATTSSEPFFSHVVYKKLVGGGYMEIVNPAIPAALSRLGYTQSQSDAITAYVMRRDEYGTLLDGKIEDAPYLKPEHYAVFDTANKCGSGKRFISPEGHVKMMGAITPHITGAISKTVNLPRDATAEDIKEIYKLSWKLGVKAIALYRDGCKVCQPLNTANTGGKEREFSEYTYQELREYIEANTVVYKPMRNKPKGIRPARVHEAAIDGLKLYITTSFYEDGRLGEIYVSSGRQGSLVKGLLDSMSTMISEMLQYGVPPQDIAKMYRGQKFEPSGFITGHPYIKFADSISDLISKIIDIELGNYDFCQVKPGQEGESPTAEARGDAFTRRFNAADYVYGEYCPNCNSDKMVKNGTCKVCAECGTTTGCS
ncbi:MAG: vitamin B12-dependent ribonucleotide reductase [Clostridiales bacterium]|nr:vitamin B12-dependent ribonucleotide reductase [Clostridiales bacterium]